MFRAEFFNLLTKMGTIPSKDLKNIADKKPKPEVISELDLLTLGEFDSVKFAQTVASKFSLRYMDLSSAKVPKETLNLLKKSDIAKFRVIPIQKTSGSVLLAIFDPTVTSYSEELRVLLKLNIDYMLTNLKAWSKLYEETSASFDELLYTISYLSIEDASAKENTPIKAEDIGEEVISLVNRILIEAYIKKASDIHIEPYENIFRVRMRIDGDLQIQSTPNKKLMLPIVSRIKILAQMDIAEKRKPQDGRIKLKIGDEVVDFRVSSLPTLFGEKIVLRILDQSNLQLDMTKLGFEAGQLKIFKDAIHKPYGMCLVTGPTGSGKTTTLYSALAELNTVDSNISTAEDPVEFNLEGINQVNVKKDIGYTFANALKSFLRQDPDIIMVGEIRDLETGEIAVEAALTGHLVLSTLHTNDAAATISRLLNMGIEPFLITGALNVVVAQRLCRKICTKCRVEEPVKKEMLIACGISPSSAEKVKMFRGKGCPNCNKTGFKGRVAIYEVLAMTSGVKEMVLANSSAEEIKKLAISEGMKTLRMSALTKAAMGLTTLEEAISNSASDTD